MGWLAALLLAQANAPPTASFTTSPSTPPSLSPPLTVTVDGSGSGDSDGTIVSWSWDWEDDGTPDASRATPASHTYTATGTYRIRLTVTDNLGATGSATALVDCSTKAAPFADIMTATPAGTLTIAFTGIGHGIDPTILSHRWDPGDGSGFITFPGLANHTGTNPPLLHTYAAAGPYVVVFRVTDDQGLWREAALPIVVYAPSDGDSGGSCGATGGGAAIWLALLAVLRRGRR